jgi:hypothetical protein
VQVPVRPPYRYQYHTTIISGASEPLPIVPLEWVTSPGLPCVRLSNGASVRGVLAMDRPPSTHKRSLFRAGLPIPQIDCGGTVLSTEVIANRDLYYSQRSRLLETTPEWVCAVRHAQAVPPAMTVRTSLIVLSSLHSLTRSIVLLLTVMVRG